MLDCVFTNWLGSINCTLTEEGYSINLGVSGQKGFPETPETPFYVPLLSICHSSNNRSDSFNSSESYDKPPPNSKKSF